MSTTTVEKAGKCYRHEGKKALLKDVPGTSNVKSKSRGGSSAKKEAARFLSAAPEAISLRMRRSFVDRPLQASPMRKRAWAFRK
jgi:hypothetical protein